ncbi:hypothetical protein [Acinetobacter sp. TUM15064]|uniref:hypothetical protein n=1 Tax=Acinetobacter sp. TUM15064 TaxID=2609134 RepID=UPI00124EF142|nr:hypothetical protein [Acinetobacter sp. TUM15064]
MANILYDYARQCFLEAQINWLTDTIKCILIDTGEYTLDASTDQYLSDIPSAARVAGPELLINKTTTGGAADADDVTFTSVTGESIEAVVIYKDTGEEATSPLIMCIDMATGLPITPNGGDMVIAWGDDDNRIFRV